MAAATTTAATIGVWLYYWMLQGGCPGGLSPPSIALLGLLFGLECWHLTWNGLCRWQGHLCCARRFKTDSLRPEELSLRETNIIAIVVCLLILLAPLAGGICPASGEASFSAGA